MLWPLLPSHWKGAKGDLILECGWFLVSQRQDTKLVVPCTWAGQEVIPTQVLQTRLFSYSFPLWSPNVPTVCAQDSTGQEP